jgi:hypothetical protein
MNYPRVCPALTFAFTSLITLLLLALMAPQLTFGQTACPAAGSGPAAPLDLRVDIADGATGELFVSWDPPSGAGPYTYNLCRAATQGPPPASLSNYSLVAYCSSASPSPKEYTTLTSGATLFCRDDNYFLGGSGSTLPLNTTYYYAVQACNTPTGGTQECGPYNVWQSQTNSYYFNTPIDCSTCTLANIPNMQGFYNASVNRKYYTAETPGKNPVPTTTVIPFALDQYPYPCIIGQTCAGSARDANQDYAYWNYNWPGLQKQDKVVVSLPGSGNLCNLADHLNTAQNLGFDVFCVNYDNDAEQNSICGPQGTGSSAGTQAQYCYWNISQAKLTYMAGPPNSPDPGNCTNPPSGNCGKDKSGNGHTGKTGMSYYLYSPYDAVIPRIVMMLYYLYCNADTATTQWEDYLVVTGTAQPCASGQTALILPNYAPNWSKIIMMGWSQGGVMSTFASYQYPVYRVINLDAPESAEAVNMGNGVYDLYPAAYYNPNGPINGNGSIYGLVSANDPRSCIKEELEGGTTVESIYADVWNAMGFTQASGNAEQDYDYYTGYPGTYSGYVFCNGTGLAGPYAPNPANQATSFTFPPTSHNFVSWAPVNPGGTGHNDPLYIWNENFWEYMLYIPPQ